jgi:RHS repeat-associated protein
LGDNREVWHANTNKTVQRTQYYPSGLPWASNTGDSASLQERKCNGKEFVEMSGYDTYDYGARGYYPAIGRFTSVDPMAENHPEISPYAYCLNNPVNMIDPDGRQAETIFIVGGVALTATEVILIAAGVITSGILWEKGADGRLQLTAETRQVVNDYLKNRKTASESHAGNINNNNTENSPIGKPKWK